MSKAIRIIVGLGNPEDKYERTLHNAGFWFADAIARKGGGSFRYEKKFDADICKVSLHGEDVWLVKPQSYMNRSGSPVRGMLDYYRLARQQLLVAHDEIDLPPGTVRLKEGGGLAGQNGLRSITQHIGTTEYVRLRIGIGRPPASQSGADWISVPGTPRKAERMCSASRGSRDSRG